MALMFVGTIAGIEIVNRLIPNRIANTQAALAGWNSQPLEDNMGGSQVLLLTIAAVGQSTTGTLRGQVLDPQGATIANAKP